MYLFNATEDKKSLDMTNQVKNCGLSLKKIKHVNFHPQGCLLVRANTNDRKKHLKYRITSSLHRNYHLFLKSNQQKVVKIMLFKISIH